MCFPSYLLFKSLTKFILIQFLVVDIIMWKILENVRKQVTEVLKLGAMSKIVWTRTI